MGTKYCKEKIVVGLLPETLMLTVLHTVCSWRCCQIPRALRQEGRTIRFKSVNATMYLRRGK